MSKLLKSFSTTKKTAEPVTIECPPTLVLKEPFLKKRRICSRRVRNPNEADRGGTCTRSSVKSVLESLINRDCSWMTHRIRHAARAEEGLLRLEPRAVQDTDGAAAHLELPQSADPP